MQHYLCGSNFANLIGVLTRNGGVSPIYWPRLSGIVCAVLARLPFTLGQHLLFDQSIHRAEVNPFPLFVLGHWRSGTTLLQESLAALPGFSAPSYYQALLPWDFLGEQRGWRFILRHVLPATRPMDNVKLSADSPAEEGLALANMSSLSIYHSFSYPARMRTIIRESVLLEDISDTQLQEWKEHYLYFLKKLSIAAPEKRLVLKDPSHTAKIPVLLELFPQAQFVTVHRNREDVIKSMLRMCRELFRIWALRSYQENELCETVDWIYENVMRRYESDKKLIPSGRLVEVEYNDLIADPIKTVMHINSLLGLSNDQELECMQ